MSKVVYEELMLFMLIMFLMQIKMDYINDRCLDSRLRVQFHFLEIFNELKYLISFQQHFCPLIYPNFSMFIEIHCCMM